MGGLSVSFAEEAIEETEAISLSHLPSTKALAGFPLEVKVLLVGAASLRRHRRNRRERS